jgi:hypothetical protein
MARPLRLEFPGALYHVTSRGNARQDIYLDDEDRRLFLDVLSETKRGQVLTSQFLCLDSPHGPPSPT